MKKKTVTINESNMTCSRLKTLCLKTIRDIRKKSTKIDKGFDNERTLWKKKSKVWLYNKVEHKINYSFQAVITDIKLTPNRE